MFFFLVLLNWSGVLFGDKRKFGLYCGIVGRIDLWKCGGFNRKLGEVRW